MDNLVAVLLALFVQTAEPRLPSPPTVNHPHNPDLRLVTTTYVCGGVERRYSLRYDVRGFQELFSASRDGRPVDRQSLEQVTAVLREYESFLLFPQCSEREDLLTAGARREGRYFEIYIIWQGERMWVGGVGPGSRPR